MMILAWRRWIQSSAILVLSAELIAAPYGDSHLIDDRKPMGGGVKQSFIPIVAA